MSRRPLPDSEIKRIREMRSDGMTYRQIIEATGRAKKTIEKYAYDATKPRLTADQIARIKALRLAGMRLEDIAAKVGCHRNTVRRYVADIIVSAKIPPETIERIREMRSAGKTLQAIADELGVTVATAHKYSDRCKPHTSQETIERMQQMRRDGATLAQIAQETETTLVTVSKYVRGIRKAKIGKTKTDVKRVRAMRREGKSYRSISERTGIAETTVKRNVVDIEVEVYEQRLTDKIDCGCRVCNETITVELPERMSDAYTWFSGAHVTCGRCDTLFMVKELLSPAELKWLMGVMDKGNHYLGNE